MSSPLAVVRANGRPGPLLASEAGVSAATLAQLQSEISKLRGEVAKANLAAARLEKEQASGVGAQTSGVGSGVDAAEIDPVPLPGLQAEAADNKLKRGMYGGTGDKAHLGGFTQYDFDGISPSVWRMFLTRWTVKSVIDVGCGRGISTLWFQTHGARVMCVEGSHDGVKRSVLPKEVIVEHDFQRGPWWPKETFDLAWSVEFLEHVGRPYMKNYWPIFHKAAILVVTHSIWGGWHHVEVHFREWWIQKMEMQGFRYSQSLSDMVKAAAKAGQFKEAPNGKPYNAQHLWTNQMVFINPKVASLPEHDHLFHESGCSGGIRKAFDCTGPDALSEKYLPLPGAGSEDGEWEAKVFPDSAPKAKGNQADPEKTGT